MKNSINVAMKGKPPSRRAGCDNAQLAGKYGTESSAMKSAGWPC